MIALLEHLKLTAQGAKVCASKLISELSAATLDAMQEMERLKPTVYLLYQSQSPLRVGYRIVPGQITLCVAILQLKK